MMRPASHVGNTIWAVVLLAALSGALWLHLDRLRLQRDLSGLEAKVAKERQGWSEERLALVTKAREVENEWRVRHDEAAAAAQAKIDRAARERDLARAAGDSLRTRADHYAGLCAGSPAGRAGATDSGEEASAAGRMLANVLGRMAADGERIAAFADALDAAHEGCQRAHDALSKARQPR